MKKRLLLPVLFSIYILTAFSQTSYHYSANLKDINNDKVSVELLTPLVKEQDVVFSFPKVIPGSYSEKDYGKYIDDFKAYDANGKKLKVSKINPDQYSIANATSLYKITYLVNDTWDEPNRDFIFQPGGSDIQAGQHVVMNNFAFYGYLEGYKMLPFEINITKPSAFYAATHLEVERSSSETDILKAPNYVYLADNPVFYSVPDTTSFVTGDSRINIAVISVNNKVKSTQVAGYLKPMADALQKFFHGLPVKSYQFLYFFEDPEHPVAGKKSAGGYGALEHNYSSLYFLPEIGFESRLKSLVNEVSSHEFLHILTPLNLHSREIEDFDFEQPKMSKHLWLYEGVTEYFAHLVQLQNGLLTEKQFLENMRKKMKEAEKFGRFSMTEMSSKVLTSEYKDKYGSVYNKGALIAFALDALIRDKTNGEKDLKKVIVLLAKKYGPGKPFDDDQLFGEFIAASHPDVKDFIDRYIIGDEQVPYETYLTALGYEYAEQKRVEGYFVGRMGLKYDEPGDHFVFTDVDKKNALGIKNSDVFISADNVAVTSSNVDDIWEKYFNNNTEKPEVSFLIMRDGKELLLQGKLFAGYAETKNYLGMENNLNEVQARYHKAYISGSE